MTPKQVAPISRNRRPAIETRSAVKPVWRPMWRTPSTARDGMEMDARRDRCPNSRLCRVVLRDSDGAAAVREILRLASQKHP
jgi:hypothetical protein